MSTLEILAINHRELICSASKSYKSHFLRLPLDLQDEIITRLDAKTLTLHGASALARSRGEKISHFGIAKYYRAVRHERRALLDTHIQAPYRLEALHSMVNKLGADQGGQLESSKASEV
jgi:hypothetical protein